MGDVPKVVSQRYFQSHLKEIEEPVEVTIQIKGTGQINTIGYYFPSKMNRLERLTDGSFVIKKTQ